jgi:hypothetical protein
LGTLKRVRLREKIPNFLLALVEFTHPSRVLKKGFRIWSICPDIPEGMDVNGTI